MNDEEWIGSLIARHERPLCRYAYSLAGSSATAQDAVQETFLRLCKARRSRLEGHEAAWLFRVCRSRVLDMLRKEKPVQTLTEQETERLISPERDPAEHVAAEETESLVRRMINRLPDRQQEAVRLKFQQHMSYREIAHVMDTSEGNVGFLIHSGIKTLREQMKKLHGAAP